jgi:solute carrier family 25 (mitochondrial phosphate transporter), member 3
MYLASRQIPYAIGQFTVNELCHEVAFRSMSEETRAKLSPTSKLSISLSSGVIAGFAAAILSQPADTLLSQINKSHGPQGTMFYRLGTLARQGGFKGLFAGLGPRMVMTAGLVSGQFLIYGAVKQGSCIPKSSPRCIRSLTYNRVAMGAPPGVEIHKESKK